MTFDLYFVIFAEVFTNHIDQKTHISRIIQVNKRQDYGLTDCPSRFNQKSGDSTLNKMTKPVAYHGWAAKKVFEMYMF